MESGYFLEVLKGGSIVQTIKWVHFLFRLIFIAILRLVGKSYFSIGRLPQCDLYMEHPSLSRYRLNLCLSSNWPIPFNIWINLILLISLFDLTGKTHCVVRNHAIIQFKASSSPEKPSGDFAYDDLKRRGYHSYFVLHIS